jgi:hypothetical protein
MFFTVFPIYWKVFAQQTPASLGNAHFSYKPTFEIDPGQTKVGRETNI